MCSDFNFNGNDESSQRFLRYKIAPGHRRNSKLLHTLDEKQIYAFNSKNKSGDAYKCVECNCRVHLKDGICIQKQRYYKHSHATKEIVQDNLSILNEIKTKCSDLSTLINDRKQSVRDIFYSILAKYPGAQIDFFKHERALQLIRCDALPKNPLDASHISNMFDRNDVLELLGKTKGGQLFFDGILEGPDYSECFFSSKKSIEIFETNELPGERKIMIDGTFDVVPLGSYKQLLIIYAVYMGKVNYEKKKLNFVENNFNFVESLSNDFDLSTRFSRSFMY